MLKISFDGQIDIATGKSRKQLKWNNRKVLWSELVKKFSETHRTAESYADYIAAKPDRQDEIKDIGGFVGGYLTNGKRGNGNVAHRQLITLDIDQAKAGFWDDFTMVYGCAAAMYSTHKHCGATPRLRLVLPLDREITADEYEPVCRKIAEGIGIEAFTDLTTYEATRLMYWPSTSKDGEFLFEMQDGEWLKADEVLGEYRNWQDSSEWPMCSKEREVVHRSIQKQQDPLEKPGVIGAFCRVYGIEQAIETFLSDKYTNGVIEGRYTYVHGSTANGLVIYDDKFAYSHHGSDPCSGKTCNAFDLVRLHKFGIHGEKAGTEQMMNFARKDENVLKQIAVERMEEAKEDFQAMAGLEPGEIVEQEDIDNADWLSKLESDKKGNYISSINNIYLAIKTDPSLKNRLYFDEFENWLKIKGNLPWRVVRKDKQDFSDDDMDCLCHHLECYQIPFSYLPKAVSLIRNDTKVHPVRDYINGLSWDGVDRLDTLLIDYLGAEDNMYVRAATRKTFIGAVARIFEPGIKFDTVLTILGEEGIGKSTIIQRMFGKWFSDCLGDIHDKSGMESLRGVWGMEVSELSGFRRADEEAIKRFIASPEDVYRPAYAKQQVRFPRQCIFIATANKEDFLRGAHKHRRFLPVSTDATVAIKNVFRDLVPHEIGQIWAETFTYYQAGESLDLSNEIKELAAKVREQHTEVDDRAGMVREYLEMLLPEDWDAKNTSERVQYIKYGRANDFDDKITGGTIERVSVCVPELWCELMEKRPGDMNNGNTKYLHDIMQKMRGWLKGKKKRYAVYGPQIEYYKPQKP